MPRMVFALTALLVSLLSAPAAGAAVTVASTVRVTVAGDAPVLTGLKAAPNLAPTADAGGPYTIDEGDALTLAGAGTDPEGAPLQFAWDLNGDGHFEDATGATPTLTAAQLSALGLGDGPVTRSVRVGVSDGVNVKLSTSTTLTVRNVAPTLTISGPEAVPSSGAVTLTLAATDVDALTGTIDWGDGTVVPFATGDVSHTYASAGARTVTVRVADPDGGEATATHAVTVASLPGPHTPTPDVTPPATQPPTPDVTPPATQPPALDVTPPATEPPAPAAISTPIPAGGVLGAVERNVRISRLRATPRCVRVSAGLKAVSSAARTIKVQFRLNTAADVKFSFKRWKKPGFSTCPPARGVAKKNGRKIAGVYSPFSERPVTAKRGLNTVTLAATGRKGKTLKPGTYLLTLTAGEASARTKVWVLAG